MPNKTDYQNAKKLCCEICHFTASKESNYNTHLTTRKHQSLINPNNKNANSEFKTYDCKCGKTYKHLSTLSNHRKTCPIVKNIQTNNLPCLLYTSDAADE